MNQFLGLVTHQPILFFIGSVLACSFVITFIMALVLHWIMRYMQEKEIAKRADAIHGGENKALKTELDALSNVNARLELEVSQLKMAILKGQIALGGVN